MRTTNLKPTYPNLLNWESEYNMPTGRSFVKIEKIAVALVKEKKDPLIINNPSALAGTLPILLGMISDGWFVAWGSKEHVRFLGGLLTWQYGNVIIIDGTTLSIMIYKPMFIPLSNTHASTHPLNHT
jgi:hypothetical protein